MPDFDLGSDAGEGIKNAWQSQSSDKASSPHREDSIDTPVELEERVGRDTQHQLQRLLNLSEASGISGRSRERGLKRSRRSSRRSRTLSRSRGKAGRNKNYICPSKIVEIFGMDIPAKTLCALSALKDETPDAILELIPGASAEQICKMCTLVEGYDDPTKPEKVAARNRKRRRRSKKDSSAKSGGDPKK